MTDPIHLPHPPFRKEEVRRTYTFDFDDFVVEDVETCVVHADGTHELTIQHDTIFVKPGWVALIVERGLTV